MAGPETLVGSLQEVGAAELLRMLALSHHTGLLRVGTSAPHWAAIADGDLVVAGSAAGPTIVQALVANGVLTQDEANTLTANAMQSRAHDLNVLPILVERLGAVLRVDAVAHTQSRQPDDAQQQREEDRQELRPYLEPRQHDALPCA